MSDQAQATVDIDPVAERLKAEQVRIEDLCLRLARDNGWCDEISRALAIMFPEGPSWPNPNRTFTSSVDGRDCSGSRVYDAEGYSRLGFNRDGHDRDGYDREGWDRRGFNRDGVNAEGVRRDDPARFRYNKTGWDADGYNAGGYDRDGYRRGHRPEDLDRYVYDADGYDAEGYNADGFNLRGFDRDGYNRNGRNAEGYSRDGYDRNGRDRNRIDQGGLRAGTDGVRRVADLDRFHAYYGPTMTPEGQGREMETPEQAAAIMVVVRAAQEMAAQS